MASYRRRLDIIADILNVVSRGAKKTQIMYQANLSYKLLNKYLSEIIEVCLVRFERRKKRYVLTSKGQKFLEKYKNYSKRNKHVEKQLGNVKVIRKVLEEYCSRP